MSGLTNARVFGKLNLFKHKKVHDKAKPAVRQGRKATGLDTRWLGCQGMQN